MEKINEYLAFTGLYQRYRHDSSATGTPMSFGVYLPPQASSGKKVPALLWLSGLTCTDENFAQKAGAFKMAANLGMGIVIPDTSPRGLDLPGEHDSYDFGSGAGFYLDATAEPWSQHYRMYSYVSKELITLCEAHFPFSGLWSISGHSMGGHGALTIGIKNPELFKSISAFSPICHPSQCPWGEKAFKGYLKDRKEWDAYDAVTLIKDKGVSQAILIDQGSKDEFLKEQLGFSYMEKLCQDQNLDIKLRLQEGYDHSYFFVSTFIEDHLNFHSQYLK